jgi:uncharacterized protein (TIGR03083 family)
MAKADIWPAVHSERKALAGDLGGVAAEQWETPSLCSNWTVRDVVAHMTATAKITPMTFFPKLIGSGFNFPRMQAKDISAESGNSPAETLARFDAVVTSVKHPPGPVDTVLGETVIHAEDIRRPLGIRHDYPTDDLVRVADFFKGSNLIIGTKRRVAGLTLQATYTDWSHGTGPTVSGPMLSLVMAMTGRKAVLPDLTGDGVATLQQRA